VPIHPCGYIYAVGDGGACPKCRKQLDGSTVPTADHAAEIPEGQDFERPEPEAARLGQRPGLTISLQGRVEDDPDLTSNPRGCNPSLLVIAMYGVFLFIHLLIFGRAPVWQPLVDVLGIVVIGGSLVLNVMGVWVGRMALGTLAATFDVWGRRQAPVMVMRVNAGDGPIPVMIANVDHGFKHGDDVVVKGYMTVRGMRASRIRNDTTGQRVWDTQPLGNVILLVLFLGLFVVDLVGMLA